jgi:hypothetical protein
MKVFAGKKGRARVSLKKMVLLQRSQFFVEKDYTKPSPQRGEFFVWEMGRD